eukprot:gene2606-2909_t
MVYTYTSMISHLRALNISLPEHSKDITAAADWLVQRLKTAGLEHVQIMPTAGPRPVVYADWLHADDAPTILIYGHYDVQLNKLWLLPVDPLELWEQPPFQPVVRDGYFYGRGVDDDKGGLLQPIHAVEAYMQTVKRLPVNVKFLLEGEEEIGSPHLERFLQEHRDFLLANGGIDAAFSADGGHVSAQQPCISTGMRGAVALEVEVTTAGMDMHSGIKGGSVQNANQALVQLLAGLKDDQGRITVPGFYDDVLDMTDDNRADVALFSETAFDEQEEQQALGVSGFLGEAGYSTLERRWFRPTLEIVGMWGGFTGQGMKTVIPKKANAKISCRLVANMRPEDVAAKVKRYLEASAPPFANVTVTISGFRAQPWVSPKDLPGNAAAAIVLKRVMGVEPLFTRDGATIPALAYFQQVLGVESSIFAFGLGDHIHAPNERLLESFYHLGREAWVQLLQQLGESRMKASGSDAGLASGKDEL